MVDDDVMTSTLACVFGEAAPRAPAPTRKTPPGPKDYPSNRPPLSEAQKRKISASLKGRKLSAEHKAKIGDANRGKKRSPEIIEAMRVRHATRNYGPPSETHRAKISASLKGRKLSPERRAKALKNLKQNKEDSNE